MKAGSQQGFEDIVVLEGRLSKRVLKEGSGGATPPLHAQCLIHYAGKLKSNGELFMDTRLEGSPARITAGRGDFQMTACYMFLYLCGEEDVLNRRGISAECFSETKTALFYEGSFWPADSVLQGAGLNIGAATMKIGEIAVFQVHPDLGYGSRGEQLPV